MKKFFLSAMAVATALSMNAGREYLTVADAGATSAYAPVYTVWYDTEDAAPQSQVIYNASLLEQIAADGGKIVGVRYYFSGNGATVWGGKFNISAGITDMDGWGLFDETPLTGLDVVLTDATIEQGAMELEYLFDTPIEYTGGNLAIETKVTEPGEYQNMAYFWGSNTSERIMNYTYTSTEGTTYNNVGSFMPKTTFIYEVETKPYDVRLDIAELNFGKVLVGEEKTLEFTITNVGLNAVTPVLDLDAPFSTSYSPVELASEESVTVAITFTPTAVDDYSTTINIACTDDLTLAFRVVAKGTDVPELTVCDGTDTNEYLPIYGYYFDGSNMATQMLYPADMLTGLEGNKILSLTFYPATTITLSSGQSQFSIGTTEETDPGASIDGLTDVAVFAPTGESLTELTLTFDEPYLYEGGTLVVNTHMLQTGGYQRIQFYGMNTNYPAGYCQWTATGHSNYTFLPKMTILYEKTDAPTAISEVSADTEGEVTYVNIMGQTSTRPFQGVNIVVRNGKAIGKIIR